MKKMYIAPKSKAYNVSTCSIIAESIPFDNNTGFDRNGDVDVKEEKGNFFWN